jgi:hypothetical protein
MYDVWKNASVLTGKPVLLGDGLRWGILRRDAFYIHDFWLHLFPSFALPGRVAAWHSRLVWRSHGA